MSADNKLLIKLSVLAVSVIGSALVLMPTPAATGDQERAEHQPAATTATTVTTAPAAIIEEDSPLWNCETMGNRICGAEHG